MLELRLERKLVPTPTYDLLASNVLSSSASSVTFSSIPATYRDLVLVVSPIATGGDFNSNIRINSDTGSNYSRVGMSGDGETATSFSATAAFILGVIASTSSPPTLGVYNFMDYSATDKHKTIISRYANPSATSAFAFRWANTSAINNLEIYASANNFASGSTFYLYGIVS